MVQEFVGFMRKGFENDFLTFVSTYNFFLAFMKITMYI